MSVQSDLMPRLTHSHPSIRKKAIVTLYRLALVYPEAFRPAWPKIKELLTSEGPESSVTAAIVNVICELGWRRPQDFLSLAPTFFDLLVEGGNNWMAIKIIKLVGVPLNSDSMQANRHRVRYIDASRATSGEEAPAATDETHTHYTSHVPSLRMYTRHYSRRHS